MLISNDAGVTLRLDRNGHDGGVVSLAIEKLPAVASPARHRSAAGGNLPLACRRLGRSTRSACCGERSGEGGDVDFLPARLVGGVGQEPAVGGKGRVQLSEISGQKGIGLPISG